MKFNKEDLERMTQNLPEEEESGPMPDTSYILDDVKEMRNRIILYKTKKIDRNLKEEEFTNKLERDYKKLYDNFPTIFQKVMLGTLELDRLEFMLKMVGEVKTNKLSKHEASVVVGQELVDNIVKPTLDENKK
jgi:hypothetical protein